MRELWRNPKVRRWVGALCLAVAVVIGMRQADADGAGDDVPPPAPLAPR